MKITATQVKDLRKSTGSPMMDCKKALTEAEGDMEKAIHLLRERGKAKAAKRIGNETTEGRIFCQISEDNKKVSVIELTCETEPVSVTEEFNAFGNAMSNLIFEGKISEIEEIKNDVEHGLLTKIRAGLGENITIRNYEMYEGDLTSFYVHSNKKVGVIIDLGLSDKSKASDEKLIELAKNLTLQIASLAPKSISTDDLDPSFLKEEMDIIKNQLKEDPKNSKKPENILEKIVEGRKGKIFGEVCLLEQEYVKEKMPIKTLIANVAKEVGTDIKVERFVRYSIG